MRGRGQGILIVRATKDGNNNIHPVSMSHVLAAEGDKSVGAHKAVEERFLDLDRGGTHVPIVDGGASLKKYSGSHWRCSRHLADELNLKGVLRCQLHVRDEGRRSPLLVNAQPLVPQQVGPQRQLPLFKQLDRSQHGPVQRLLLPHVHGHTIENLRHVVSCVPVEAASCT